MRKKIARAGIRKFVLPAMLLLALLLLSADAQFRRRGGFGSFHGGYSPEAIQEQDQMQKALNPNFKEDVFTFARLIFEPDYSGALGGGRIWEDDSPEADLNLTFRLFQVTSLKIRPGLNYINITTRELERYPFVYLAASGQLRFEGPGSHRPAPLFAQWRLPHGR